ncbi:MAG: excinuclease ABC subunit UvrC [Selenomonadaceae bacterium]|nr:excinuclease ABC subunit UvrC [Selenomonadaceae bacterium]
MIDDEIIKAMPETTGVYIMRDGDGEIIYVGKALNIRTRIRQHAADKSIKERLLTEHTVAIETINTGTEVEALLLECELIKKHQPRYNVSLKDGKNYPCIKLTNEQYPRACVVRRIIDDGSRYFGPYTNASAMHESLKLIRKIFPLRTCKRFHKRPCLEFHIKRCLAPCVNAVDPQQYNELVDAVALFLDGQTDRIENDLTSKMIAAADQLDFERAAQLRDKLFAIKKLAEIQRIINARNAVDIEQRDPTVGVNELQRYLNLPYRPTRMECFDISHNQGSETVASMVVFVDGEPDKRSYRRFKIRSTEGKPDDFASMREVTYRRYHDADRLPDLIVIDGGLGQLSSALEVIRAEHVEVPVVALAKQFELVYVESSSEPIELPRGSEALHLMQRIRDEAHRFAITYHRLLRWKRNLRSKK